MTGPLFMAEYRALLKAHHALKNQLIQVSGWEQLLPQFPLLLVCRHTFSIPRVKLSCVGIYKRHFGINKFQQWASFDEQIVEKVDRLLTESM